MMISDAPRWHDKMSEQAQEIIEFRANVEKYQRELVSLNEKVRELTEFKMRTIERWRLAKTPEQK